MSAAETAKLLASLDMDTRKFQAGGQKAIGTLDKLSAKTVAVGTAIGVGLERLAEVGIRKLTGAITGGLDSLAQLEDATTSVDGAIAQVGKGWTVTSAQIAEKANQIEAATQAAFDDKAITQSTTTLIRYGKITQENLFPAMEVMTDLAARTGSVESASEALAKALADPTKATRLLRTAGVTLTKDQQKQIATWVKQGKLSKAQAFLLGEVAKQTKGAAAAMHGPFRDSQLMLQDVVEDAQRALGTGLLPVIMEVRKELSEQLAKKSTLDNIKKFGEGLAGGLRDVVGFIKSVPWDTVGDVLKGAATFGQNIAQAFLGLPTEAKGLILGLAALNKLSGGAVINVGVDLLKGVGGTLFQQFLGKGSPANPMFVVPVGGGLGGGVPGGVGAGAGSLVAALGGAGVILGVGYLVGEGFASWLRKNNLPVGAGGGATYRTPTTTNTKTVGMLGARTGGLSPDERQEINDTQRALEKIRTSAESNRIAVVSATRSGDQSIVSAIRGLDLVQNITINLPKPGTFTYRTGGTLSSTKLTKLTDLAST